MPIVIYAMNGDAPNTQSGSGSSHGSPQPTWQVACNDENFFSMGPQVASSEKLANQVALLRRGNQLSVADVGVIRPGFRGTSHDLLGADLQEHQRRSCSKRANGYWSTL